MGNFAGHLIPGIFFIIYGAWWCLNSICFHLKHKKTRSDVITLHGEDGQSTVEDEHFKKGVNHSSFFEYKHNMILSRKSWVPAFFCPRYPLESFIKILLPSMGIFVEAFLTYNENHHLVAFIYHIRNNDSHFNDLGKLYHITLYSGFLLSGIVDLFSVCLKFPSPTSTIFLSLSFLTEGLLFHFHTLGQDPFNIAVHLPIVYIIFSCFVFTLLRLYSPSNIVINLGLGGSILFQGTWLIQIGYFLFGGFLCEDETATHEHVMFVTASFSWHLLIISIGNLVLFSLLTLILKSKRHILRNGRRKRRRTYGFHMRRKKLSEEHSRLMVNKDSDKAMDEEIEMQQIKESFA